ncbi:MAG: BamA/TamA family outer membrane protein [Bacteroidota bacterium]
MNKLGLVKYRFAKTVFFALLCVLIYTACSPIRKYPIASFLLKRNYISINKSNIRPEELKPLLKQKPTRKNFGLYLNIRFWNFASRGKETGLKRWVKNTVAAEPVLLDTTLSENTVRQMKYFLQNKGYFHPDVSFRTKYKKRTAKTYYTIVTNQVYKVRNINYSISDATLKAYVYADMNDRLFQTDDYYDVDKMDAERDRITKYLQNNGYYNFSKDYISFLADSTLNTHQIDITIKISNLLLPYEQNPDSLITSKHKRYSINKIVINTDYDRDRSASTKYDTIRAVIPNRLKNRPPKVYYFCYLGKLKINLRTLAQTIYFDSNDVYNYSDIEKTYKSLLDLKIYRYVNIEFTDLKDTSEVSGKLDCLIKLSKSATQALGVSTDATHTAGELGLQASLIYTNKNLFYGAELYDLKFNAAVDFQSFKKSSSTLKPVIPNLSFIHTIETGIELNIKIPRFLIPIRQQRFPKYFKPKTNINLSFNYQIRPEFERYYGIGSFGYQWKESEQKTHYLTPININLVKIFPDSTFRSQVDSLKDPSLQNTFRDHITTAISYSFVYNTQNINRKEDFVYVRTNVELAGFLFWAYSKIQKKQGAYQLFGIPYSQYYRIDADFRYYMYFNDQNYTVFRTYAGYGAPLNNANTLPFEKSFYSGGANSMRAWRLKSLGPGSYKDAATYALDKIGEIGIEINLEYRFPIYKFLKGAAFIDIGNVWLRKKTDLFPGGEFQFSRFFSELAFDGGLGLRADFGYFVIRLDGAFVLKDPAMPKHNRWIGQNDNRFLVFGNFGIGYPF